MKALIKQPAETWKEVIAFAGSPALAELGGIAAVARGLVTGAAALDVSGELVDGALVATIGGGTDGERYLVTATAVTEAGETLEAELEVAVIDGTWIMPDGGAPYLSITDFVARVGLDEVVAATDTAGDGRIDRDMLVKALADAQALADVYISAAFTVPLDPVPAIVETAVADLARARLYPRGAPDGVDGAAKTAMQILTRISEGKLPLPSSTPLEAAPAQAPVMVTPGKRRYPDDLDCY
jgi:phage gp36-like protein